MGTIFSNIRSKSLRLELKWFPSHLGESPEERAKRKKKVKKTMPIPEWVTQWHIRGNEAADALAAEAAAAYQLSSEIAKPVLAAVDLVSKIQRRLVYLVCNVTHRTIPRKPKVNKPRQLSLREATVGSRHTFFLSRY